MDKYKKLIIRHESARSLVRDLKTKRSDLLNSCENIDKVEYPQGSGYYQEHGKTCLSNAFDEMLQLCEEHQSGVSYSEVLNDMRCGEEICDSCYEAYQIKTGALAEAKNEFGNAKRAIYYAGKKLLKEQENG